MLDNGFEVNIGGLSDSYVMQKLNKVFKLLKLKRDKENKLEFKRKAQIHDFKLKQLVQHFIDELAEDKKESDESDNNSDSDDSSSGSISDDSELSSDKKSSKKRTRKYSQESSESDVVEKGQKTTLNEEQKVPNKLEALNSKIN